MKKFLSLLGVVSLLVLGAAPALALWDQYLPGEGGIISPQERQENDVHNYSASGAQAEQDIAFVEAGILGPVDRPSEDKVTLADCNNPFEGSMGEAGTLGPLDRDSC
jgi:hypothetical protein